MADYENEETQEFKVSDRRRFSAEGTTDQPQEPEKQKQQEVPPQSQEAPKDEPKKKRTRSKSAGGILNIDSELGPNSIVPAWSGPDA